MSRIATRAVLAMALASSAAVASPAAAATFFENFDNGAYQGSPVLLNDTSDRFGPTDYYRINDLNGWTFSGTTPLYAVHSGTTDGALLLNEPSGTASISLTGLTPGKTYLVSLLLSGDNRPGVAYNFNAAIDGNGIIATTGIDGAAGANAGRTVTGRFLATGTSATLSLDQLGSPGEASPMIDNINVAAVPEPATWAMMLIGFGMVGFGLRARRAGKIGTRVNFA